MNKLLTPAKLDRVIWLYWRARKKRIEKKQLSRIDRHIDEEIRRCWA
jgi:hypothetical protein